MIGGWAVKYQSVSARIDTCDRLMSRLLSWNTYLPQYGTPGVPPRPPAPPVPAPAPAPAAGGSPAAVGSGAAPRPPAACGPSRSEEHTSELQSQSNLVCRLLLEKKKKKNKILHTVAAHHADL